MGGFEQQGGGLGSNAGGYIAGLNHEGPCADQSSSKQSSCGEHGRGTKFELRYYLKSQNKHDLWGSSAINGLPKISQTTDAARSTLSDGLGSKIFAGHADFCMFRIVTRHTPPLPRRRTVSCLGQSLARRTNVHRGRDSCSVRSCAAADSISSLQRFVLWLIANGARRSCVPRCPLVPLPTQIDLFCSLQEWRASLPGSKAALYEGDSGERGVVCTQVLHTAQCIGLPQVDSLCEASYLFSSRAARLGGRIGLPHPHAAGHQRFPR